MQESPLYRHITILYYRSRQYRIVLARQIGNMAGKHGTRLCNRKDVVVVNERLLRQKLLLPAGFVLRQLISNNMFLQVIISQHVSPHCPP